MSVPADNSRKNNANVVKSFKPSKKHFANHLLSKIMFGGNYVFYKIYL